MNRAIYEAPEIFVQEIKIENRLMLVSNATRECGLSSRRSNWLPGLVILKRVKPSPFDRGRKTWELFQRYELTPVSARACEHIIDTNKMIIAYTKPVALLMVRSGFVVGSLKDWRNLWVRWTLYRFCLFLKTLRTFTNCDNYMSNNDNNNNYLHFHLWFVPKNGYICM